MAEALEADKLQKTTNELPSNALTDWSRALEEYKKAQDEQLRRLQALFSLAQTAEQQVIDNTLFGAVSGPPSSEVAASETESDRHDKQSVDQDLSGGNETSTIAGEAQRRERPLGVPESVFNRYLFSGVALSENDWEEQGFGDILRNMHLRPDHKWTYSVLGSDTDMEPSGKIPGFIPSWELVRSETDNEVFYHIDDVALCHPLRFTEPLVHSSRGDPEKTTEIPYSFAPAITFLDENWRFYKVPISWPKVNKAIGSLSAAPPDGRMELAFDRTHLRRLQHQGLLDGYLSQFSAACGSDACHLEVWDIQDTGYQWSYKRSDLLMEDAFETMPPYAWGALDALEAEGSYENSFPAVTVTSRGINIMSGAYPEASGWPRPWYRLIYLDRIPELFPESYSLDTADSFVHGEESEGLSTPLSSGSAATRRVTRLFFVPWTPRDKSFQPDTDSMELVEQAIDWHLLCHQHQPLHLSMVDTWRPLHFTWHHLFEPGYKPAPSAWPTGRFYLDKKRQVQKQSFTLLYIPDQFSCRPWLTPSELLKSPQSLQPGYFYWTILVLSPESQNDSMFSRHDTFHGSNYQGPDPEMTDRNPILLKVVFYWLKSAVEAHIAVADVFDEEFGAEPMILAPDQHDRLLIDDDDFSRSKKYFWAVSFLEALIKQVEDAKDEMGLFLETRCKFHKKCYIEANIDKLGAKGDSREWDEWWDDWIIRIERETVKLRLIKSRFETTHKRILTLRDGLFNASSVSESRASTRLAQNVKLLTYVSIFYLPLSFCVALWSINENYSRPPLIITATFIGGATYLLVANMHSFDALRRTILYDFVGRSVLQKMRGLGVDDGKWEDKANGIRGFRVEERTKTTSKWVVLRLWGVLGFAWVKGLFRKGGDVGAEISTDDVDTHELPQFIDQHTSRPTYPSAASEWRNSE